MFITTPQFLPQHHEQREHTRTLIATAQATGQTRVVEMNQQVLANLDRIITALEADEDEAPQAPREDTQDKAVADAG